MVYAQVLLKLKDKKSLCFISQPEQSLHEGNQNLNYKLTFEEFYKEHYLKWCYGRQESYNTKAYAINVLPDWFKKLKFDEIGTKDLELLQSHYIQKGLAKATINKYLTIVKHSFTKAYEWEMIPEQSLKKIRKVKPLRGENKRLRFLSQDEIQALLNSCEPHLYPIVFTALNTGMRKSEILNLKWQQIDLKHGFILLEKTKNGERREIPMNEPLKQMFRELFTDRKLDTEYVFANPKTGRPYTKDLKRSFHTACRKAGIRDFKFHDLRHTFASQLVMNGVDLKTVQELLGHKDIKMTLRYSHLSHAHKKEAVNVLGKVVYQNFITFLSQSK